MRRLSCIAAAVLLATATVGAHANSVSYAEFSVEGRVLHALVRLPLDDVDLLLRIDRDLDGRISSAELVASTSTICGYLSKHLRVGVNGASPAATFGRVAIWRDPSAFEYLESELSYEAPRAVAQLSIHTDLLTELYPSHKTLGRITAGGREDRFTFGSTATYQRRTISDRTTGLALVIVALTVFGLLWLGRRRATSAVAAVVLIAAAAQADVIMSAAALNATLKKMESLKRQAEAPAPQRGEALFQLGAEADGLAAILNREVESHGMQERELLDLALSRTRELGIGIAYNREKKKFFYDGAAFVQYVTEAPRGAHAAAAEFKLLSYQFYQLTPTDIAAIGAAADAKTRFLARHPRFEANAELRLYLAVDYRDLHRRYVERHDRTSAAKYRQLARGECQRIVRLYPHTEQADAARQLLRGLNQSR